MNINHISVSHMFSVSLNAKEIKRKLKYKGIVMIIK